MFADRIVTLVIMAAIAAVTFWGWNDPRIQNRLVLNPFLMRQRGQYERLLTAGFLHGNLMHLLLNVFVLLSFGPVMEAWFLSILGLVPGRLAYLGLVLLGIVVASLPATIRHRNNPTYSALGASGGVSAVVFAFILLAPTAPLRLFLIPIDIPALILGVLYLIYSYWMARRGGDSIGHEAHFAGAVFGMVYTIAIYPASLMEFVEKLRAWEW